MILKLGLLRDKVNVIINSLRNGSIIADLTIEVFGETEEEAAMLVQDVSSADFTTLTVAGQTYTVEYEVVGK